MKAVVETCVRADFGVKDIKITKPRIEDSEMSACFHKLKELVPSVPQHKRISKVALLQHVIDYILDLEITLEKHPAMTSIPPPLAAVCRSPLAEKSDLNAQIEKSLCMIRDDRLSLTDSGTSDSQRSSTHTYTEGKRYTRTCSRPDPRAARRSEADVAILRISSSWDIDDNCG